MAEDLRLNVVTDSDSRGLVEAERELAATKKEAGELGDVFVSAGKDSEKLDKSLHEQTDQIRKLQAEYARTRTKVHDLQLEWLDADRENDQIVRRDLRRERSRLSELQRVAKEMEGALHIKFNADFSDFTKVGEEAVAEAGFSLSQTFSKAFAGGITSPGGLAAIGGLLTAAVPPLLAMTGGVIGGALGTGAMAAGILSSIKDPRVQAAAREFGNDISSEFFSSDQFVEPVISGLHILRNEFNSLDVEGLLAPLAPTVTTIAEGIADFARNLKAAGLQDALARMPDFAHVAAQGFAEMGKALGFFIDEVTSSPGSLEGLRAAFAILDGTLVLLGRTVKLGSDAFHGFNLAVQGVFEHLPTWIPYVKELRHEMEQITGITPKVSGQMVFLSNSEHVAARNAEAQAAALQQLRDELQNTERALTDMINTELGMDNANLAVQRGWLDLRETLKENGRHWETNTKAGLDNRQAVLDQVAALERQREQTIANTGDVRGANAEFDKQVQKLKDIAYQAKLTGKDLDDLVGTYPINFQLNVIGNAAAAIVNQFAGLFQGAFRAAGGPVEANRPYVVGDGGRPELFVPRSSGYVYPDVPTGAASTGSTVRVLFDVTGADEDFKKLIRKMVRLDGGTGSDSVQLAFG